MYKAVLLLSGGIDSTVLLWKLLYGGYLVNCLTVNYGQRHIKEELSAAAVFAKGQEVQPRIRSLVLPLREIAPLFGASTSQIVKEDVSSKPSPEVPEGHYTDDSMKVTVVPNRNMILLSLAGAWAVATKSEYIAYAAHAGDHTIYPDCRPEFAEIMGEALNICDWMPIKLLTPFIGISKTDIVKMGHYLKAPLHLTWSCYKGGNIHCGKCGTCVERKEAFRNADVHDPTVYSA